ncbi:hypothetical protein RHGRI_013214 [Rhododendron griersonianum]|uniref:RING-type E3 ubiquitin transferase n=1 Tax=Rhododendron griersonianum TaxID=479676 RepID=A0AAV6K506_9ERIC|nr:hypothetical protein RHGRI_013214 [Rhododendron griersonianum]
MNQLVFLLLLLLSVLCFVQAQSAPGQNNSSRSNFKPSLAIVIGIMSIMVSLTFILIVYAKFCRRTDNARNDDHQSVNNLQIPNGFVRQNSLYRGVDKTVIESIPFFRFSSLKGSRRGLECTVCLSKFEDVEILRLLPNCKHAFHIGCIDEWLEKHSGCPLCRVKVDAEDLGTITYADSTRFLSSQQAEVIDDPGGELFIQREDSTRSVSSRFNFRNSLRKSGRGVMKAEESPVQENDDAVDERNNSTHKLNHKIIVPDVVLKKRWSYLSSSDHVKLNSEMLGDVSRKRFSCIDIDTLENSTRRATEEGGISEFKEETGRKAVFEPKVGKLNRNNSFPSSRDANYTNRSGVSNANDKRSMSESTGFSRFKRNGSARESPVAQNGGKKDRFKRLWLPIAQRTVQWYADRDKKSQQSNNMRESLNV